MKTEYKIVWIDDDFESVEEDVSAVRNFLDGHGITANIQELAFDGDVDDIGLIKESVNDPDLDLIVVDFLMGTKNGSEIINTIRNSEHIFLPVVFYSSVGVENLADEVSSQGLDGVYLSPRNGVRNKIQLVITSLIRKEQSSKRTRGLLMEGVSEIDATFGDLLEKIWERLSVMERDKLREYFKKKVDSKCKALQKAVDTFPSNESDFWSHARSQFVSGNYDTMFRWQVILWGLKTSRVDSEMQSIFRELFERDDSEPLIKLRNKYGHLTRLQIEAIHNDSLCVHIRKELRRQSQNLKAIEGRLGEQS